MEDVRTTEGCASSFIKGEYVWIPWLNSMTVISNKWFYFIFLKDLFICILVYCICLQTPQKRASDLIMDGNEPPCGCCDLNSGPLGRSVSALNHWAISPAPINYFMPKSNKRQAWLCTPAISGALEAQVGWLHMQYTLGLQSEFMFGPVRSYNGTS